MNYYLINAINGQLLGCPACACTKESQASPKLMRPPWPVNGSRTETAGTGTLTAPEKIEQSFKRQHPAWLDRFKA